MERLYAPWRLNYITGGEAKKAGPTGCIFCDRPAEGPEHDAENYIVERGETCFVILNAFPYNSGHLMVVPYRHISLPSEMTPAECAELMTTTARFLRNPDGRLTSRTASISA